MLLSGIFCVSHGVTGKEGTIHLQLQDKKKKKNILKKLNTRGQTRPQRVKTNRKNKEQTQSKTIKKPGNTEEQEQAVIHSSTKPITD